MARNDDIQHAMLIVSGSEQFHVMAKKVLPPGKLMSVDSCKSASGARRCILERYYDMIVINAPLQDEPGIELVHLAADQSSASVLVIVPADIYGDTMSQVTDKGVMVIAKPFPKAMLGYAIRYMSAQQRKLRMLEKKLSSMQERMEELRVVSKAKVLLVEKKNMTEDEAHHYIGKMAMDRGMSRKYIADVIIELLS